MFLLTYALSVCFYFSLSVVEKASSKEPESLAKSYREKRFSQSDARLEERDASYLYPTPGRGYANQVSSGHEGPQGFFYAFD